MKVSFIWGEVSKPLPFFCNSNEGKNNGGATKC